MPPSLPFKSPRTPFIVACVVSFGLVGGGVLMAQLLNLAACPLCIVQRMLYLLLGLVAAAGIGLAGRPLARRIAALLMAVIAATGLFVAGYQIWLQRFARDTKCAVDTPWWEQLVDWAGAQAPLLFQPNGLCSDAAWKFLGLSIAEWSSLAFAGLLALALAAVWRRLPA
jgi:disulfide bond formation protein DsbB